MEMPDHPVEDTLCLAVGITAIIDAIAFGQLPRCHTRLVSCEQVFAVSLGQSGKGVLKHSPIRLVKQSGGGIFIGWELHEDGFAFIAAIDRRVDGDGSRGVPTHTGITGHEAIFIGLPSIALPGALHDALVRPFLSLGFTVEIASAEGQEFIDAGGILEEDSHAALSVNVNVTVGIRYSAYKMKEFGMGNFGHVGAIAGCVIKEGTLIGGVTRILLELLFHGSHLLALQIGVD